jgi:hypothetical protein
MKVFFVDLPGEIHWIVRRGDPASTPLCHPPGWEFLNPLLLPALGFPPPPGPFQRWRTIRIADDACHFSTWGLGLAVPDAVAEERATVEAVVSLLQRLRTISRQATMPTNWVAIVDAIPVGTLPTPVFPSRWVGGGGLHRRYEIDSAVTADAIAKLGGLPPDFLPPVHESCLLDAIKAATAQDWRTALLYAAISIETIVGTVIAEEHERQLEGAQVPEHLRSIEVEKDGRKQRTDPIYNFLRSKDNRFAFKLHELLLYVFRQSLKEENRGLYDRAVQLYETRNQLAHSGKVGSGKNTLPLTYEGAMTALECAARIFNWFGIPGNWPLPRVGMFPYQGSTDLERVKPVAPE